MIGPFRSRIVLAGSFALAESARIERPLLISLSEPRARVLPRLGGRIRVEGEIDAPGFADHKPVKGRVETELLRPMSARYEIEFENDAGQACRLLAARRPNPRDLLFSASSVSGEIVDREGRSLARVALRLDYRRDLKRLLVG